MLLPALPQHFIQEQGTSAWWQNCVAQPALHLIAPPLQLLSLAANGTRPSVTGLFTLWGADTSSQLQQVYCIVDLYGTPTLSCQIKAELLVQEEKQRQGAGRETKGSQVPPGTSPEPDALVFFRSEACESKSHRAEQ